MALPDTREETVTSAGQVKSATINKIQDQIVGMKKPRHWRWFTFLKGQHLEASVTFNYFEVIASADAGFVSRPVDFLVPGEIIYGIKVRLFGSAAAGNTLAALLEHRDTITTTLDTFSIVNPGAAYADYSKSYGSPFTVADGKIYGVSLTLAKNTRACAGIAFDIGKP